MSSLKLPIPLSTPTRTMEKSVIKPISPIIPPSRARVREGEKHEMNLRIAIATIFTLCFTCAMSIAYSLGHPFVAGYLLSWAVGGAVSAIRTYLRGEKPPCRHRITLTLSPDSLNYQATLNSDPGKQGWSRTAYEAIGSLVVQHRDELEIEIVWPPDGLRKRTDIAATFHGIREALLQFGPGAR